MKIKKDSISNVLLILIGIFCQISPLMSRSGMAFYLGICIVLFILSINSKKMKFGIGFIWFLVFTIFCLFSLTYTINNINPEYVYIRIIPNLLLLFLATPFFEKEEKIKKMVKGFVIGGVIGITIVLINQYNLIGVRRLGDNLYGSCAEFGNVCMLALACFIWLKDSFLKNRTIRSIAILYIILGTLLSGARKAILVPLLMLMFLQLFDKRKNISKRIFFLIIISTFSLVLVYASLNNEQLYNIIGYRIESGLSSVLGTEKEDASLNERSRFKELAKNMIVEKPFFGWGIHSFAMKNFYENGKLVFSHDGYLEVLSCYGIVGFILFYWIFLYVILNRSKMLHNDTGIFLFSYILIILLMEPYSICFYNGYYLLLIGAAANLVKKGENIDERITKKDIINYSR